MNSSVLRATVVVNNPQGLHMRPAAAFAKLAQSFQSRVTVFRADRPVDGKSGWDLLLLAATQGVELVIEVAGDDAEEALPVLAGVLAAESDDQVPPKG